MEACAFEKISVYTDESCVFHCECYSCNHWLQTTFSLSYFLRHGLKIGEDIIDISQRGERGLKFKITEQLVSKSFAVLEQCMDNTVHRPSTLLSLAFHHVWKLGFKDIYALPLPTSILDMMKEGSVMEDTLLREAMSGGGFSCFKPWTFPLFLYRHLGRVIVVSSRSVDT